MRNEVNIKFNYFVALSMVTLLFNPVILRFLLCIFRVMYHEYAVMDDIVFSS
jgi:hypothetical protein